MVGPPPSFSSSSWRNPSAEIASKYNLVEALPESFSATPQEENLLKMYEKVKAYEKEALRIKEDQARAKLAAADLKYKQSMETTTTNEEVKKPRKKKQKRTIEAGGMMDEEEEYSNDEEQEAEDLHERREQKLAEMREELQEAKEKETKAAAKEEAMRASLLKEEAVDDESGPSLKRKIVDTAPDNKSSLLTHLEDQATPPHEFSKSLELKSWAGKILFPSSTDATSWSPPASATQPNEGALNLELPDFDIAQAQHGQGNNTLVIKFTAPADAKRFSLNIAGPDHADFYSVLFHFNPRALERGGQVVINDKKEGIWGQGLNIPLSQLPLIFGEASSTLIIQINGDGFDVFCEDTHCARLEHRQQLPAGRCTLNLQFPSTDDYGSPELWTVYRVWWGNKKSMAKSDLSGVAGVNVFSTLHPRKLFISGLHRISTQPEVDLRRAELERAFRKYGGDHGVIATVPMNTTFAFVELETERQSDLALQEMQDQYRLNRARRSRHEALQEERAVAEASKEGVAAKDTSDWD